MHRHDALLLLLAAASALTALAAPPAPPPPPPPPHVSPRGAAPPGACEKLGPCELFAQLQEHSRRIAGFSYNVKKADAALTALARQQAAAAARTDRLAHALSQIEVGLEGLASAAAAGNGSAVAGSGAERRLPVGPPVGPAPAGDWEQAAARELARLGDRLSRLREQVNTSFVRTIRENGEELEALRVRVANLTVQVEDLAAGMRGETVGGRVVIQGESPVSFAAPTPAAAEFSVTRPTTALPITDHQAQTGPTHTSMTPSASSATEVMVTTDLSDAACETVANAAEEQNTALASATSVQTTEENVTEATGEETPPSEDVQTGVIGSTQNEVDVAEQNGNANNGNGNGNGESVDSLGIELETVRTAFDTLHAQVTDLQARCDTRGDELEALVSSLEQRLASWEAKRDVSQQAAIQEPHALLSTATPTYNDVSTETEGSAAEEETETIKQLDGAEIVTQSSVTEIISNQSETTANAVPATDSTLDDQVGEVIQVGDDHVGEFGEVIQEDTTIVTDIGSFTSIRDVQMSEETTTSISVNK